MIRKISSLAVLTVLFCACSPALPGAKGEKTPEITAEKKVSESAKKAHFYANQAQARLAEAQQLHSEVEAMLVEARAIKSQCAAAAKQAVVRRKAAQRKAVEKKAEPPKPVIDPNYSPSDMPDISQ